MLDLPYNPARLAREVLEEYFFREEVDYQRLEFAGDIQAGSFVSLKNRADNSLRGCIGTIEPCQETLACEVACNALSAALKDPRFPALRAEELEEVYITVDVLGSQEKVEDRGELNPEEFGVVVVKGNCRGVLLPDLEGVDSVERQLNIAAQKAGLSAREIEQGDFIIYRFPVHRYKEEQQ